MKELRQGMEVRTKFYFVRLALEQQCDRDVENFLVQVQDDAESVSVEPATNAPPAPIVKHPLEHRWTFWFFENNRNKGWLENLHEVYSFDTVEDFWW